jgi:4'-phosphopantetheinyl transferase
VLSVWWASPASVTPWHSSLLSPAEAARAATFQRAEDRARSVVAAALLRLIVAPLLDRSPADVPVTRACPSCDRPHGRPVIAGSPWHVSVSHSGDRIGVAVTDRAPVGVDVEAVSRFDSLALASSVLAPSEAPFEDMRGFLRYWCRKESVLKATGDGLRVPLRSVVVSSPQCPPRLIAFESRPEVVSAASVYDLDPGEGHMAALTVLAASAGAVTELDGTPLLVA